MDQSERAQIKLRVMADLEGSELGDGAGAVLEFLEFGSTNYIIGEEVMAAIAKEAEESCDAWFEQERHDMAREISEGVAFEGTTNTMAINEDLEKWGLAAIWPEGYSKPTAEDLEAKGLCAKHPHQSYYSPPKNGCDTCVRLYVQKKDAKT